MLSPKTLILLATTLASLALAAPTQENPLNNNIETRDAQAAEQEGPATQLQARATYGRFTYFNAGLGACGKWNTGSDYIVALGGALFDPYSPGGNPNKNTLCGKRIRASYGGKNVTVTVADKCGSCTASDLDFSRAAFQAMAPLSVGLMYGTWEWIDAI